MLWTVIATAGSKWLNFNTTAICGLASPIHVINYAVAERSYNVGPPYALHRRDWMKLLPVWTKFVPLVWADYPNVPGPNKDPTRHYAEMFAYSMAGIENTSPVIQSCVCHYHIHSVLIIAIH